MIKNIFYYLLAFITLCYDVWHFLSIIFTTIEKKIPDALDNNYSYSYLYNDDSFRFSIASLLVLLPIYIGISWYINRRIENGQMESESKIRHVMIYSTLLLSVLAISGSLVSVIYNYLGGEITDRFVYKALSVSLVSIAIAAYYYYTLNRDYKVMTKKPLIIGATVLIVVFAICIYCVSVVGSPTEVRNRKLDDKSLSNLSNIESSLYQVYNNSIKYYNDDKSYILPVDIETEDTFKSYITDPNTNKPYPYRVISQDKTKAVFELCPTFASELTKADKGTYGSNYPHTIGDVYIYDNNIYMSHAKGRTCYQTTIKKIMYDTNNNIAKPVM